MLQSGSSYPNPRKARRLGFGLLLSLVTVAGCGGGGGQAGFNKLDEFGRTYYLDGAGNWGAAGHAQVDVPEPR